MDLKSIVAEVGGWPIEDRVRLLDEIWAGLLEQDYAPDLTAEQRSELERRVVEDDSTPEDVESWTDVRAAALKRAGR